MGCYVTALEDLTYSALDTASSLEALLRMLQHNVGVVIGPDHAIHVPRDGDEEGRIGKLLHCPLDDFANLDVANLEKLLCKDGRP